MDQLKRVTKTSTVSQSLILALALAVCKCRDEIEPEVPERVRRAALLYGIKIKRR